VTTPDGARRWTLGKAIGFWRERRRLTQLQLAARAGLSEDTLKSVEQGRRPKPGFFTVARIAAALEVGLDQLVTDPLPLHW
jgi:transcriptional regulator with XRE-family HTH domain